MTDWIISKLYLLNEFLAPISAVSLIVVPFIFLLAIPRRIRNYSCSVIIGTSFFIGASFWGYGFLFLVMNYGFWGTLLLSVIVSCLVRGIGYAAIAIGVMLWHQSWEPAIVLSIGIIMVNVIRFFAFWIMEKHQPTES